MRDYLYIWINKKENYLVASGIEFKDLVPLLPSDCGLILLDHSYDYADHDFNTRFDFVEASELINLAQEDIYEYGNFVCVDFKENLSNLSKREISELLYFSHMGSPLQEIQINSIKNSFLYSAHDDGWFLKLYYSNVNLIKKLFESLKIRNNIEIFNRVYQKKEALWISGNVVETEERTIDINKVLNKRQ